GCHRGHHACRRPAQAAHRATPSPLAGATLPALSPRGKPSEKPGALSGRQRLRRQRGVTPLRYQSGEMRPPTRERMTRLACYWHPLTPFLPPAQRPGETPYLSTTPIRTWQLPEREPVTELLFRHLRHQLIGHIDVRVHRLHV